MGKGWGGGVVSQETRSMGNVDESFATESQHAVYRTNTLGGRLVEPKTVFEFEVVNEICCVLFSLPYFLRFQNSSFCVD